jgi:hypothetical protein
VEETKPVRPTDLITLPNVASLVRPLVADSALVSEFVELYEQNSYNPSTVQLETFFRNNFHDGDAEIRTGFAAYMAATRETAIWKAAGVDPAKAFLGGYERQTHENSKAGARQRGRTGAGHTVP